MRSIIIDDEKKARSLLKTMIKENCTSIDTILEASDLKQGVEIIKQEKPDIVFLDIEMPEQFGLQILDFFETPVDFQIIFTTAYNEYAIEAFKVSAIDYLLKPIDNKELTTAVRKAEEALRKQELDNRLVSLQKNLRQLSVNKIALEVPRGFLFVNHDDILLLEADGMYTKVYLKSGESKLISKPLKYFADQLENKSLFFKCHRSFVINLKYIKELTNNDAGFIVMENKKVVPISKSRKQEFIKVIQDVFW
ncbi:LytR/AlgR family response regulator transcription factor [Flexithrix dorotheae]|uniref:LytR/AlgR family response regulator transcription factor n=1 Tax=Flexithrix dorotheae TaxID=70993 RepID=UPI0003752767|nr:LytTR family DNA-binding domain-containing protein [Flexithrix dorotheae]